jgi:hypothetical protein
MFGQAVSKYIIRNNKNFKLGRDEKLTHLLAVLIVNPFTDSTLPLRSEIVWRYTCSVNSSGVKQS